MSRSSQHCKHAAHEQPCYDRHCEVIIGSKLQETLTSKVRFLSNLAWPSLREICTLLSTSKCTLLSTNKGDFQGGYVCNHGGVVGIKLLTTKATSVELPL